MQILVTFHSLFTTSGTFSLLLSRYYPSFLQFSCKNLAAFAYFSHFSLLFYYFRNLCCNLFCYFKVFSQFSIQIFLLFAYFHHFSSLLEHFLLLSEYFPSFLPIFLSNPAATLVNLLFFFPTFGKFSLLLFDSSQSFPPIFLPKVAALTYFSHFFTTFGRFFLFFLLFSKFLSFCSFLNIFITLNLI